MDSGDTAQRSLEHWSESGLCEMKKFYALATEDYRQLALAAAPALVRLQRDRRPPGRWTLG